MSERLESSPKRVRAYLDGAPVVDSTRTQLLFGRRPYPVYAFPAEDVAVDRLDGEHVEVRDDGLVVVEDWRVADTWFEEDQQVFVHPHDPYSRIDVLQGSRHVRVEVEATVVAETQRPTLLLETGLPPRWYVPKLDVRLDLLEPSDTTTGCAYKGFAGYFTVVVGDRRLVDGAWYYDTPLPEVAPIVGHVCFDDEMFDIQVG